MNRLGNVLLYLFPCMSSLVLSAEQVDLKTLRLVSVLYRHGDRTPIEIFPTNIYQIDSWQRGLGQLTTEGVRQEYELGKYLRERYNGFLNSTYHKKEIFVQSTDKDRALMSAQSVMAGLYPPVKSDQWDHGEAQLDWQPIPVHADSREHDPFLYQSNEACPKRSEIVEEGYHKPAALEFFNQHKDIWETVRIKTNITGVDWTDPQLAMLTTGHVNDNFECENFHSMKQEEWAEELAEKLQSLNLQAFFHWSVTCGVGNSRFFGGPLVNKIVKDMQFSVSDEEVPDSADSSRASKMYMYSAHDSTVISFLCALQLYKNQSVPYSTMVIVELHDLADLGHVVRVYLHNDVEKPPQQLEIPGCSQDCPLEKFVNLTERVRSLDIRKECFTPSGWIPVELHLNSVGGIVFLSCVIGTMLLIICGLSMALCRARTKNIRTRLHYGRLRHDVPEQMPMMTSMDDE